jgi:hypothetical protein
MGSTKAFGGYGFCFFGTCNGCIFFLHSRLTGSGNPLGHFDMPSFWRADEGPSALGGILVILIL